jgi:hypothetical protein
MSTHFCKVGKTKPNLNKLFQLKNFKDKTVKFIEVSSKPNGSKDLDVAS